MLVQFAYGTDAVEGLPSWTYSQYYDVWARKEGNFSKDQVLEMTRNLLGDRFQLIAHWTTVDRGGYALIRLPNATTSPLASKPDHVVDGPGNILSFTTKAIMHGTSMRGFAKFLAKQLQKPVDDETGLEGGFDFEIKYADPTLNAGESSTLGPSLFTALKAIGLELRPKRVDVKVLTVDHISKPSEN